jgi:hypothetical protein
VVYCGDAAGITSSGTRPVLITRAMNIYVPITYRISVRARSDELGLVQQQSSCQATSAVRLTLVNVPVVSTCLCEGYEPQLTGGRKPHA